MLSLVYNWLSLKYFKVVLSIFCFNLDYGNKPEPKEKLICLQADQFEVILTCNTSLSFVLYFDLFIVQNWILFNSNLSSVANHFQAYRMFV